MSFPPPCGPPPSPYPGARAYYDNFVDRYGSPTEYHGAEAYAAMFVIADALKRTKSLSPEDVRNALAKTDMMTAFGPVKFVSYGKKTPAKQAPDIPGAVDKRKARNSLAKEHSHDQICIPGA